MLAAVTSVAAAQPTPERCQLGLHHAANKDLPRAALYLEGCADLALPAELADQVRRTRADVAAKLENSKLSAMSVVTTPEGMLAETDAMPGERFMTPATIWTKAGDYTVNVAPDAATLDAGKGMTTTATIEAFSRRTVIINIPQKKQAQPKDGEVDFRDEAEEQKTEIGPPPAQKFGSILPTKYRKPSGSPGGGEQLDDPLAYRESSAAWRLSARLGGGLVMPTEGDATGSSDTGASFSLAALAARPLAAGVSLQTRMGWTRRKVDSFALEVGFGLRIAESRSVVLSAGAGVRGDVRVQDQLAMDEVARVGIGGSVELDLALRALPVSLALRVEPMFTELTPGVRAHAVMLEVGVDWR